MAKQKPAWHYFTTQKEWEQYLKDLVKSNDTALLRAIVLIYDNQTPEEKQNEESVTDNNIGFTKWDAKEMSEIAKKIKAGEQLTAGEMAKSRNKMQKYWKQLMHISKKQQAEKEAQELAEAQQQLEEQKKLREEQFRDSIEIMRKCSEEGIACDFGICDECPLTQGYQMCLNLGGTNND
ncbi:MAG: hypothetical protein KBT03_03520 [Bacteroidales bacterium]|nr:hypothetical protein [Candidatus Scybalousia scybalohippi]